MPAGKEEDSNFHVTDRRFWAQDDSAIDQAPVPDQKYPSYVEELKARTQLAEQKLKEKVKELEEQNEAFRARLRREMEKRVEREKPDLFQDFLELIDNFERALEASQATPDMEGLREGVRLNLELFLNKLKSIGIEPIDLLHQPFDPHESEAIEVVPIDDPGLDQKIVAVLERGYRWGDQLLRPARVRIGRFQPEERAASKQE